MSTRSFFWHGYQFPVCARCTGVLIGYLITLILFAAGYQGSLRISVICALIMLCDWILQFGNLLHSTNLRRLVTGILGGYGVLSAQIHIVVFLFHLIIKT